MLERGYKEIADPLYSTIQIPREIVAIVDHPLVQRLRRVRQLQTVHRVYPSATHTRFEHSLGVMHLAGIFARSLFDDEYSVKLAMLGGLLHDIGHGPFSHTFDEVIRKIYKPGRNHEVFGHRLIVDTDLADVIEQAGVDPKEVVRFLEAEMKPLSYTVVYRPYPADILDFINRDRFYTNVDVAPVKRERLIRNSYVEGDKIILASKALDTLKTLLISRRDLFTKVYLHKTSLILDSIVRRILHAFYDKYARVLDKALEGDYSEFLMLTDDNIIRDAYREKSTRDLAELILSRNLPLKCIYRAEKSINDEMSPDVIARGYKESIEEVLAKHKIEDGYVYVSVIKTIPDNPFDEQGRIPTDRGYVKYSEILPDKSLYMLYVRVYVPREKEVSDALIEEIAKTLSPNRKIGITM